MQTPYPSLTQVVMGDFRAQQFINMASLLALFALFILLLLFQRYGMFGLLLLLVAAGVGVLAFWRVRFLRAILDDAAETSAQVDSVSRSLLARRGHYIYRVKYHYTYQGQDYRSTCLVRSMAAAPLVQPGETVTVLVHREKPQHALLPRLYLEEGSTKSS